ncbi:MAG: molecular chaperone HtpG [Bacteroidales bacterium]|nr:molecular chaperone HtpG [Bacteroidales bacterium]MDZ4204944.1 molecular chaperone HtpG [Bacteroidales bacterium]
MEKGSINVKTENIFPIIKKFLYSDHEIFLRELISNAVDATQKLKTLASVGEFKEELGDLTIEVILDAHKKTLTVKDKGIGMTAAEVDQYINQIAFSGAEEFVEKYKGKGDAEVLIGHFGLGFYSSFMVSKKVDIISKSYKNTEDAYPVKWSCDGSPEFTINKTKKGNRGTDVVLHINDESKEFLEEYRIKELLRKYCKFLPIPIQFGTEKVFEKLEGEITEDGKPKTLEVEKPRIINDINPLWKRKPAELKDEEYKTFYHDLYPTTFDEPLFNIHLNVDYPFNLTGVLYFPKVRNNYEMQRNKIQLYCNQVFVTDSVEGIVPDFLTLLHGVLDSPDIPLNVSRSYLQSDANVKKISNHIMKKVADKLENIFKENREEFEKKWDDIKIFIEYGIVSEPNFYERAEKFALFKNTEGNYFTFEEYKDKVQTLQTDKNKQLVYLYATQLDEQHSFIEAAKERGYDVLVMDGTIDTHFINTLEQKLADTTFARVDSNLVDKLIEKEDALPPVLSEDQIKQLKELVQEQVDKNRFHVSAESMNPDDQPMLITRPEFMRRMKDMAALGGGYTFMGDMPEHLNLLVNLNHRLIVQLLDEKDEDRRKSLTKQMIDLALLSQNMLKGQPLTEFIKRSLEIIK